MIYTPASDTAYTFSVKPPLFLPFYNEWGKNAYYKYEPFSLDPFTLDCSSTSGSPVVLSPNAFFGFLTDEVYGNFSYDGKGTLTVFVPKGQSLYTEEGCDAFAAWERYNALVTEKFEKTPVMDFYGGLEYCTWVDQKNLAARRNIADVHAVLCEEYVYDYMRRIDRLGLERGKLTIDDGWDQRQTGRGLSYGNWELDRDKFPHFEKLVRDIADNGFYPGLWFSPFMATANSEIGKKHPELLGNLFGGGESDADDRLRFLHPSEVLYPYYESVFAPYIAMGIKKLKLDVSYGPKAEMKALLKILRDVIKKLDSTVEIETHIPDIFVSRYADTVRINDVAFDEAGAWRGVTAEHYKVCFYSAAGKILNFDHMGTNTPEPKEQEYLEHSEILTSFTRGFPCVSLLPDVFGPDAEKRFCAAVKNRKH